MGEPMPPEAGCSLNELHFMICSFKIELAFPFFLVSTGVHGPERAAGSCHLRNPRVEYFPQADVYARPLRVGRQCLRGERGEVDVLLKQPAPVGLGTRHHQDQVFLGGGSGRGGGFLGLQTGNQRGGCLKNRGSM